MEEVKEKSFIKKHSGWFWFAGMCVVFLVWLLWDANSEMIINALIFLVLALTFQFLWIFGFLKFFKILESDEKRKKSEALKALNVSSYQSKPVDAVSESDKLVSEESMKEIKKNLTSGNVLFKISSSAKVTKFLNLSLAVSIIFLWIAGEAVFAAYFIWIIVAFFVLVFYWLYDFAVNSSNDEFMVFKSDQRTFFSKEKTITIQDIKSLRVGAESARYAGSWDVLEIRTGNASFRLVPDNPRKDLRNFLKVNNLAESPVSLAGKIESIFYLFFLTFIVVACFFPSYGIRIIQPLREFLERVLL